MAKARKLKSRRKRAPSGKAIRISNAVLNYLSPRIKGLRSYDAYLRRAFGIDDWQGNPQSLVEGYLETTTGTFFLKTESWEQARMSADELAIMEAARRKTKKINKPIRLREIP